MSENGTTEPTNSRVRRAGEAARSGLDVMLGEAATGGPPRFLAPGSAIKVGAGLARHPRRVAARASGLAAQLRRVGAGRSEIAPRGVTGASRTPPGRATGCSGGCSRATSRSARPSTGLSPTRRSTGGPSGEPGWRPGTCSTRWPRRTSPGPIQRCSRRRSTPAAATSCEAARRLVNDLSTPPRLPATVDTSKFEVGEQPGGYAGLGGAAYRRIRADPVQAHDRAGAGSTAPVHPADDQQVLHPRHRSRTQHDRILRGAGPAGVRDLLAQPGRRSRATSTSTPTPRRVVEARGAVAAIAGTRAVHLAAACSGGIITAGCSGTSPRRAARRRRQSFADGLRARQRQAGTAVGARPPATSAAAAVAESARKGYLDGQALAGVFTWLRPNDLVWNYVVNNYLLGKDAARVRHPLLEPGHACAWRPACTATSSRSDWTMRSHPRMRSRCSARRSTWVGRRRHYFVAG